MSKHRTTCQCTRCYYGNRIFWITLGIVSVAFLILGIYNSNHAW